MYASQLGRFVSEDPLVSDPAILYDNNWMGDRLTRLRNGYGYVDNNPANVVDPSGLIPDEWLQPRVPPAAAPAPPAAPRPARRPPSPRRGDWLDCMANCIREKELHHAVIVATLPGCIRVPKGRVLPGQFETKNIMTTKAVRAVTGYSQPAARIVGRGFLALLIFEGFYDIGAELACLLICNDLYPRVDSTPYRP